MRWICLGLLFAAAAWAQNEADHPIFEVVSIRPSGSGDYRIEGGPGTKDPGRFTAIGVCLWELIKEAYQIEFDQLSGPPWLGSVHCTNFDVNATIPPGATKEQFRQMLQNLLADRFEMQVHHETRMLPVYELTVAKNGPKLKPSPRPGPHTDDFDPGDGPASVDQDGFIIVPPGRRFGAFSEGPTGARFTYRMRTMEDFARGLNAPDAAGRRVIDKTGLTGQYDFNLYYWPTYLGPTAPDAYAPTLEQAVQQQLGLKLLSTKAPIDFVVVDHAEKMPTEN